MQMFDDDTAPNGWLVADGAIYNISDYPSLANHFERVHGSKNYYGGDGTTSFAVPDWQGEFFRASGTNSHPNQGSGGAVGEHQNGTIVPNVIVQDTTAYFPHKQGMNSQPNYIDSKFRYNDEIKNISITSTQQVTWGEYDLYTVRPTNTSLLCCIKAVPAGINYSLEEQEIGTWIDWKKLYQKTIEGTVSEYHNIQYKSIGASIDKVCDIKGIIGNSGALIGSTNDAMNTGVAFAVLPNSDTSYPNTIMCYQKPSGQTSMVGRKYIVTLQYTKTTD